MMRNLNLFEIVEIDENDNKNDKKSNFCFCVLRNMLIFHNKFYNFLSKFRMLLIYIKGKHGYICWAHLICLKFFKLVKRIIKLIIINNCVFCFLRNILIFHNKFYNFLSKFENLIICFDIDKVENWIHMMRNFNLFEFV